MIDQLIFDTTSADTIADSHKVLAGILSTDGSTLITDTLEGGKQGLDVYVINTSLTVTTGAEKAEDAAHSSGDTGNFILAVANHTEGALHSADGDYAALQVDSSGRLRVVADVDVSNLSEKNEDDPHSSGDTGSYVLAVRQDTLAASTSADGDYASFKVDSVGSLYVKATDTDALLTTIDAVLDSIKVDTGVIAGDTTSIDATLTALSKAEDSVHSSGDQGIMGLAVRNDAGTALAADGDYIPLTTDSSGSLRVAASLTLNSEYAEDSAHSSGETGQFVLGVRQDTLAASTSADGDYGAFKMDSVGRLYVTGEDDALANTALSATAVSVDTTVGGTDLAGTDLANRKYAFIYNNGNRRVFIGNSGVTAATGFPLTPRGYLELRAGASIDLHAIAAGGTQDVRFLELS